MLVEYSSVLPVSHGRKGMGWELPVNVLISPGLYLSKVTLLQLHAHGWSLYLAELLEAHQEKDLMWLWIQRLYTNTSNAMLYQNTASWGRSLQGAMSYIQLNFSWPLSYTSSHIKGLLREGSCDLFFSLFVFWFFVYFFFLAVGSTWSLQGTMEGGSALSLGCSCAPSWCPVQSSVPQCLEEVYCSFIYMPWVGI